MLGSQQKIIDVLIKIPKHLGKEMSVLVKYAICLTSHCVVPLEMSDKLGLRKKQQIEMKWLGNNLMCYHIYHYILLLSTNSRV